MSRTLPPPIAYSLSKYDVVCDIDAANLEARGSEIVECLAQKGFCLIELCPKEKILDGAVPAVLRLEDKNRFYVPPAEVADGLLGEQGSALVCDIDSSPDSEEAPALRAADEALFTVGALLEPYLEPRLGIETQGRTHGLLHQASDLPDQVPQLTEAECDRWLQPLLGAQLMAVLFLGPSTGSLLLQPFRDEDCPPIEVETEPGMLVFLRPDLLSHRHFEGPEATGCAALSCWFRRPPTGGPGFCTDEDTVSPTAWRLLQWSMERLSVLKAQQKGDSWNGLPPDLPRNWELAMDHLFDNGNRVPIKSVSCRFPGTSCHHEFWAGLSAGSDLAVKVRPERWDMTEWYDPNIDSHKWHKSYASHGVFIDGANLFDHRFFSISYQEARGMDPSQYLLLEAGYMALFSAGYTKKKLVQKLIGVYIGQGLVESPQMDQAVSNGTGGSRAVSCGRISFCLAMQGPCVALDADAATAFACLEVAYHSLRNQARTFQTAIAGSAVLTFSPEAYVKACAAGWLNPKGRCLTFDQAAAGYVKSEGAGFACLGAPPDTVDGVPVEDLDPKVGVFCAIELGNSGIAASMHAPAGPAEQKLVVDALRQATLSPLNVETVESFGEGDILTDAVEISNLSRCLRGLEPGALPLHVGAAMTQVGFMREAAGFVQLLKLLEGLSFGVQAPSLHLRRLSPQVEEAAMEALGLHSESLPCRLPRNFVGVSSRGLGGTVTHAIVTGEVSEARDLPHVQPLAPGAVGPDSLAFWPAGNGTTEDDHQHEYCIVGSWSGWKEPEPMVCEGGGVYGCTVVLGENCFEQFNFLLDGDPELVLYPNRPKAPSSSRACGPDDIGHTLSWMIDARPQWVEVPASEEGAEVPANTAVSKVRYMLDPSTTAGSPGDRYHVRLRVAGQWRAVDWQRLGGPEAGGRGRVQAAADYYLVGSWNDWEVEPHKPMVPDAEEEGVFYRDVCLTHFGLNEFQILRNGDWDQVFYPAEPRMTASHPGDPALGPDDCGDGLNWALDGSRGDLFRVRFSRIRKDGIDTCSVSWEPLRPCDAATSLPPWSPRW